MRGKQKAPPYKVYVLKHTESPRNAVFAVSLPVLLDPYHAYDGCEGAVYLT